METFGIIVIVSLAYILHQQGGLGSEIILLGMLALTAQRILPLVNQSYFSYTCMRGQQASFEDILNLLSESEIPKPVINETLDFKNKIHLNQVSFGYLKNQTVLNNLTLSIKKGEKIGVVGKTASGKSTLADLVTCLLKIDTGSIKIDDKTLNINNYHLWQKKISYVSQAIFLTDSTIAQNIAFGEGKSDIDYARVEECAKKSQLEESINILDKKYYTVVGEKGVKLSGGQRQRLAIARALYRKCEFLVLDEATSALDTETEKLVMNSIMHLDESITMLIIAHRTSTLAGCDRVVELSHGVISFQGTYKEFIERKENI
jgi:ABC-type multidrug transport system fused ATPase/permease subunit